MPTTLVLIVLLGLLGAGLFMVNQWKRSRIRRTGTLVMAKVTQCRVGEMLRERTSLSNRR